MAYPKNDDRFIDFTVSQVFDEGENWRIRSNTVFDDYIVPKSIFLWIKLGTKCRVYHTADMCRGLYVAGRIVKPYRSQEDFNKWQRSFTKERTRRLKPPT